MSKRADDARARRAAETPEQREARLAKRRAAHATPDRKAKHAAYMRKYYAANRDRFRDYQLKKQAAEGYAEAERLRSRRRAGIVDATAETLSGVCPVCLKWHESLVYDHDHATGRFRGWLCARCNLELGWTEEDLPRAIRAVDYLLAATQASLDTGWPED